MARTAPRWALLSRGTANIPKTQGYENFEGIVETDTWFGPLFTNVRLTRINSPVEFHRRYPLFQVQPLLRQCYGEPSFEVREAADLEAEHWQRFAATMTPNTEQMRALGHYAVDTRRRLRGGAMNSECLAIQLMIAQGVLFAAETAAILGEPVTRLRWTGAAVGFVGALLIAKPAFAGWHGAYLIALFGTGLNGLSFVLNRYLQQEDTATTTMFYSNLVPVLANIPAFMIGEFPTSETILWTPAIFFLGPVGMYCGIVAVKHASAAMLGPYTFLRLVIAVGGGVVVFHELPDIFSACGAALILGGCVLASWATDAPNRQAAGWTWCAYGLRHRRVGGATQRTKILKVQKA